MTKAGKCLLVLGIILIIPPIVLLFIAVFGGNVSEHQVKAAAIMGLIGISCSIFHSGLGWVEKK